MKFAGVCRDALMSWNARATRLFRSILAIRDYLATGTPETMRLAMIENLRQAEPYSHQKGIFPAREAIVMQQQDRGLSGISVSDVFIGNGVSELIDLSLRALLNPGDEVLVPSPDYPLWSAAVTLNGGKTVHYPCSPVSRSIFPRPTTLPGCAKPPTNI